MSQHEDHLLNLMTAMQIGYYSNLRYSEGKVLNQKQATDVMRTIAKEAIQKRTLPRAFFMYAKMFMVSTNPLEVIEQALTLYNARTNGESDGTMAE